MKILETLIRHKVEQKQIYLWYEFAKYVLTNTRITKKVLLLLDHPSYIYYKYKQISKYDYPVSGIMYIYILYYLQKNNYQGRNKLKYPFLVCSQFYDSIKLMIIVKKGCQF